MSCKDKHFPINPAPFAPGDCGPCGPRPPRPPMPPMKPGCPPSQYIGSRYVPIFAEPIDWDINRAYESLTIVTYNGESYTSKCNVGPGIDITNTRYWAKTGAYNAQVEQYKSAVDDLSSQVTGFASDNKEFREKIDKYEKDNADMKNTVAEDKARVDALAERVSTAETEIDGLQATTAQHTTELADLHAKDEDLQRQITSNDNDIAAIQAKNVEQDSRLDGIDTKLKSHDASIAQNTSDIAKNTKNIQDNAVNIAENAHELADHAEELADHEARLTSQHKEITANHEAIERNTSDIDSLRSDLTEDEAKIESNRDAIAHIQEKDVQQDGRLDKLEECCADAKTHFAQLDTKTDKTNTDLAAEIERAKAAELANGKLIAANAAELADHAEELADHEKRITALETDNTKNKSDIADIKAKNVEQDTAINAAKDAAAHAQETADTANGKADANATTIGSWEANHPGKTISEAVTDANTSIVNNTTQITTVKNGLSATNEKVTELENTKADKTDIPDTSNFVTKSVYESGQAAQDERIESLGGVPSDEIIFDAPFTNFSTGIDFGTSPRTIFVGYIPFPNGYDVGSDHYAPTVSGVFGAGATKAKLNLLFIPYDTMTPTTTEIVINVSKLHLWPDSYGARITADFSASSPASMEKNGIAFVTGITFNLASLPDTFTDGPWNFLPIRYVAQG